MGIFGVLLGTLEFRLAITSLRSEQLSVSVIPFHPVEGCLKVIFSLLIGLL